MNSLAKYLIESLIQEEAKGVTVLLPGGFKPPHAGHLELAMAYYGLPQVSKIVILIGPSPRNNITRDQSIKIWKLLLKDVPNVEIKPTEVESPLTAAYKYIETAPKGTYALASSQKGEDYGRVQKFVQDHNQDGKYARSGVVVQELPVDTKPSLYKGRSDSQNNKGISASVLRSDLKTKNLKNFASNYPDVPKDVIAKIYQILTKSVTESVELINEGGAAGHLAHPYEDVNLSFKDVKNMIDASLSGKLNLAQEKLDGQNLMVSYKNGQVVAARNKGQIKNYGENSLSIEQMKKQFSNRGEIQVAFVEAMNDLEAAVRKLTPQEKEEIFDNGKKFISLEILYPGTANVIPYGAAQLRLHHVKTYDENGNVVAEDQEPVKRLQAAIETQKAENQKTYQIRTTDPATIKPDQDYQAKRDEFVSELNAIKDKFSLSEDDKLSLYFYNWWKDYIKQNAKNYRYKIPGNVLELLINRWAFTDKSTSIKAILQQVESEDFKNWIRQFEATELKTQKGIAGRPIESLFLKLGARVLKNIENLVSANPDKSVASMKKSLKDAIIQIKQAASSPGYADSETALAFLKRELNRLKELGGYEAIVPTEGLVFTYNGKLYKLTGAFAPINQILGYLRF